MEAEAETEAAGEIELFEYPVCADAPPLPAWNGWEEATEAAAPTEPARARAKSPAAPETKAEFDERLAEETRRSFEAARERGRQEGRQAEREAQAAALEAAQQERGRQAAELIGSFAQERDRYLRAVEHEVVRLALAIAARILRREAQMDPLLLTGAVRVALGQLAGTTEVRLRAPAAELELWTEAIALLPNLALKPTVIAGEGMRAGDCAIETALGAVDLGIRAQLAEIERGFFDRTVVGGGDAVPRQRQLAEGEGEAEA
jgi:flagellar assembly protein FliH